MKTKHVLLISAGVLAAAGIVFALTRKKDENKSNFTSCRAGTCPFTRTDGSIFCTSSACNKIAQS